MAAWVRRKRFEAGLLAQALYFGGPAPKAKAKPTKEQDFWEMLTGAPGVAVVNVEGTNGNQAG